MSDLFGSTAPVLQAPKATKHEISVSADYLLGKGDVTLPLGFSLAKVPGLGGNIVPNVAKPDRDSDYYGATISYSFGQAWYLDLGYARGNSSGDVDVLLGPPPALASKFEIDDTWYQAYVRYTFPRLRGKRLSVYLRAGVSFVEAELTDTTTIPALGLYKQTDDTTDILGNLGFGVGYSLYTSRRVRFGLQVEGEGFYGQRSQDSLEVLPQAGPGFPFQTAKIDNDLYGGTGRATLRFEYRLGQSGLFKIFADGGVQAKYTEIDYSGLGSYDELLWGPYVKLGIRYAF
ncbi:MAG: autotransporter outer membrane beta-barrel domain-containing protein [Verrucomicrobia bacterium]|nr:autotransporter outer membrane beta-barrel domain-containing protein [Verrucomicrobiota bacterium]